MPSPGVPGTTATIPVPTVPNGILANDLLVCFLYVCWDTNFGTSTDIVPPVGWTEVLQGSLPYSDVAMGDRLAVFYLVSSGLEPADYAFTWAQNAAWIGRIVAFRGVDPADPVLGAASMPVSADSDPISAEAPAVVTTVADQQILCVWAARAGNAWTLPADVENLSQSSGGTDVLSGVILDQAAGGGVANGTMNVGLETVAVPGNTGGRTATAQVALPPPDGIGIAYTIALNPLPA